MRPLHDYMARQLAERLKTRRVAVGYDKRPDFAPFHRQNPGEAMATGYGDRRYGGRLHGTACGI